MSGDENIDVSPLDVWSILPDQDLVWLQDSKTIQPRRNWAVVVAKHIGYRDFSHHPVPAEIHDP
jgi:hypothetical protein